MTGAAKLYIFSGLPGAGKSTLALGLSRHKKAVYLRADSIEQAILNSGGALLGPEGYSVGYSIAKDNLILGLSVVSDSVNPWELTRNAWRGVAQEAKAESIEIEVICSDETEHRERVETRKSEIIGLKLPTWAEVTGRDYQPWSRDVLRIDTAGRTPEQSLLELLDSVIF